MIILRKGHKVIINNFKTALLVLTLCYFTPSRAAEAFVIGVAEENANVLNFENEHFSGSMANAVNCVLARIDQGFRRVLN